MEVGNDVIIILSQQLTNIINRKKRREIGESTQINWHKKDFLSRKPLAQALKLKINKWDFMYQKSQKRTLPLEQRSRLQNKKRFLSTIHQLVD